MARHVCAASRACNLRFMCFDGKLSASAHTIPFLLCGAAFIARVQLAYSYARASVLEGYRPRGASLFEMSSREIRQTRALTGLNARRE